MNKTVNTAMFIFTAVTFTICLAFRPRHSAETKPAVAFTFDDGSVADFGPFKLEEWNEMLLRHLEKHRLKAILFSTGQNKTSAKGQYVLKSWNDAGHFIANHTYSHPNFNRNEVSLSQFRNELLRNDAIIRKYSNYLPYFRFPYLKEGNTPEKTDGFRKFLKEKGYRNGYVTIDASDWYINGRLVSRLGADPGADLSGYREFYKEHLFARAEYYDSLSTVLTGRKIDHVILLHHNLAAALFLDDLVSHFKAKGWEVRNADEAYKDPVYFPVTDRLPAGESLIWAMAKQSGKFENVLRYPAEDGEYEKARMDKLKL